MKKSKSDNGVTVVEREVLSIIYNAEFSRKEKINLLKTIKTDARPGKVKAEDLIDKYLLKFKEYEERNILGYAPRGIEMYGYSFINEIFKGIVIEEKLTKEYKFEKYIGKLCSELHYSLRPRFSYEDINKASKSKKDRNEVRLKFLKIIAEKKQLSDKLIEIDRVEKAKIKASKFNGSLTDYLINHFPYREATGKWAGGDTTIKVFTRAGFESEGIGESETAWSDNGKWRGKNAIYKFYVRPSEELQVIGGLATIYKKQDKNKTVKKAVWFEQGRGFELNKKTGFLVGGYHSEAKTKELAIKGAQRHKKYWLKNDTDKITISFARKRWGFCESGIKNFMQVNGIETDNITMKELRNIVIKNREINCRNYKDHLRKMGIVLNCK